MAYFDSIEFQRRGLITGTINVLPEKVPEKTPGAWFTKLSITAPGLRLGHELVLSLALEVPHSP